MAAALVDVTYKVPDNVDGTTPTASAASATFHDYDIIW